MSDHIANPINLSVFIFTKFIFIYIIFIYIYKNLIL